MRHHHEIHQRELDGLFDVVCGDEVAGPFPTIAFAMRVASGEKPNSIRNEKGKFRRSCGGRRMHPDQERNPAEAATKARAISHTNSEYIDNAITRDALQASRIARMYAVTYATAATIARLAYAVAR